MITNHEYAAGLRLLAEFYEGRPDAPQPYQSDRLTFNLTTRRDMQTVVREFGGRFTKDSSYGLIYLYGTFGPFRIVAYTSQENVCTARVVGERVIPARPAEPERTEPVLEWDCGSLMEDA